MIPPASIRFAWLHQENKPFCVYCQSATPAPLVSLWVAYSKAKRARLEGKQKMLAQFLLPMLQSSFGAGTFTIGTDPLVIFPAAHYQVGELRIFEVGWEGRIEIGDLAHGHFYAFGCHSTSEEAAQELAENIFDFVVDLFAERVVLWQAESGRAGGWFILEGQEPILAPVEAPNIKLFHWAGPIQS